MRRLSKVKTVLGWAKQQSKVLAGLTTGLVIGAGSAVVFAAIPDGNGVIHGCYRSSGALANGSLRIIDSAAQTCNNNETALAWNQTGPQGPAGPTGPQGPAGSGGPGGFLSNLVNADFTGASLQYRDFASIDLHGSIFNAASLVGSDFAGANLSGASFVGNNTKIAGANFAGANLSAITLDIDGLNMVNTDFQNADFTDASIAGQVLSTGGGGNFQGVNLANATIAMQFWGANFQGVDFSETASLAGAAFGHGSNLTNTNFSDITVTNLQIYGSDMTGADFSNGVFTTLIVTEGTTVGNADFTDAQFTDSILIGTDFSGATLTGSTWNNTECPDGTNSDANGNTCLGHLTP